MVKLTSARQSRMYGPSSSRDMLENVNAFLYLVGTVLLAAGFLLMLPTYHMRTTGWWLVLAGLAVIVLVNLHDLYAHLAGIDFNFSLLSLDPQLWLIELAAPLVQAIGGILLFTGAYFLLRASQGAYGAGELHGALKHAILLLIVGASLWLLGSIHNLFQVYEKANLRVQAVQKAVSIPFLIASTLFVVSAVLALQAFLGHGKSHKLQSIVIWLALVASGLLVLAAVLNFIRVAALQQVHRYRGHLEWLRGGAQERLTHAREQSTPFLASRAAKYHSDIESVEQSGHPSYKGAVVRAENTAIVR